MAKYYVELKVRLEYDVEGEGDRDVDEEIINDQLEHLVDHAYGNGQFTGTYDMTCTILSHGTRIEEKEG